MKLNELKTQVDNAIELVREHEQDPEKIQVALQIDHSQTESICADDQLEVHWDNNGMASGCVITGYTDDPGWQAATKIVKGCVVMLKRESCIPGYGNPQCVSEVIEPIDEIYLYGQNQGCKTWHIDKVLEYPIIKQKQ